MSSVSLVKDGCYFPMSAAAYQANSPSETRQVTVCFTRRVHIKKQANSPPETRQAPHHRLQAPYLAYWDHPHQCQSLQQIIDALPVSHGQQKSNLKEVSHTWEGQI